MPRTLLAAVAASILVLGCSRVPDTGQSADSMSADTMPASSGTDAVRPKFRLDSDERFDPGALGSFADSHDDVYAHIDENLEQHIANIQRWVRQPSISAQDIGIRDMATLLRDDLLSMGFSEAELVKTDGHPGVWGYYNAGAEKTLLLYMMYDVQPVNPEDWSSPPFDAELVEHELGTVLMGRGATNQKGPERAFLNAVQSIINVEGKLPVNLMVAAEGEEELGSPHYPQIVDQYEERMRMADGAIFPFNSQRPDGTLSLILGVKGIIYFELEASGGAHGGPVKAEIHGSYKASVDSPVWRLVHALASMTSSDGNTILVPGYYDELRPISDEEERLMNTVLANLSDEQTRQNLGVERWIDGMTPEEAELERLFQATLNIDGIWAGYTGPGTKTILPHMATAKVDSRLPPGLDPEEALQKIRAHLDASGFDDIEIRLLGGYPAAQTSVEAPMVQAAIRVGNKYASEVIVNPRVAGSAPFYQFTERLGLPMVPYGVGFGTGSHAPDEIMLIEPKDGVRAAGLAEIEKSYVDFLYALANE